LFGNRGDIEPLLQVANNYGLYFIEDCAQAYCGPEWLGSHGADISLFSFGPIKTQTALGGAVVRARDPTILERMRAIETGYPRQSRWSYLGRLAKYGLLKELMRRWRFALVSRLCKAARWDLDRLMRHSSRSFGGELLTAIRRRASLPLLNMLVRRLRTFDESRLHARRKRGEYLNRLRHVVNIPGSRCRYRTWWLFPVLCDEPGALIQHLRRAGFDASRAHSLVDFCQTSAGDAEESDNWLARTAFLPCYPEMPWSEIERLADVVLEHVLGPAFAEGHADEQRAQSVAATPRSIERKNPVRQDGGNNTIGSQPVRR
jgi:dTDP-4-amino-4,6-dideoxygalactose transaminase